jgi:hypothetical protein
MKEPTLPFGGLNMLFAGDFAQLPPPVGGENVSLYSRMIGQSGTSVLAQEKAMGRALWHQVTTVVILRQNMRQSTQSKADDRFRQALNNMRYKACTLADIQFLRSLITSQLPGRPSITDEAFKFVSIITAKNVQKDEINRLGCQMFAQHTGQQLIDFYSEDTLLPPGSLERKKEPGTTKQTWPKQSLAQQKLLWNLPHSSSDRPVPGKLSICLGLPIMIKCNVATELCITNGQEAIIVGWQSTVGLFNQRLIDVLFVELKTPPKTVQIGGLPINVVPLTRSTIHITCRLPDGNKLNISRSQVEILPNFAMTDFASQGKTRPYNPVDINNCKSHQAYYTALSRSSTANGTIILQGFDPKKITGRASGALRQEFRDLELLDEITTMRFLGLLPSSVSGDRRNDLIHTFRLYKGMSYVPGAVHPSIKWSETDPMLEPITYDSPWKIIMHSGLTKAPPLIQVSQSSTVIPQVNSKRKETESLPDHKAKFCKMSLDVNDMGSNQHMDMCSLTPVGTKWHQNSCAYDAVLCILHSIWSSEKNIYTGIFGDFNAVLRQLAQNFCNHASGATTLESARDDARRHLHRLSPVHFSWGQFTSVTVLLEYLLSMPTPVIQSDFVCVNGHCSENRMTNSRCCLLAVASTESASVTDWMHDLKEETNVTCSYCLEKMKIAHRFLLPLPLIVLDVSSNQLQIDATFSLLVNNEECTYGLQGIVYYGDSHFTARVVSKSGMVWFHDGIATGQSLLYEGTILTFTGSFNLCRGKEAAVVVYAKL